jgi:2',3'-cyclic-nucleotide 2'-phosphodiesterase (5'-nucleotidase family)
MAVRILHTNDFHGALDEARLERLRELRTQADLYFDSGDAIKSGNLAIPLKPDPAWARLAELGCSASVPGNRESHILEAALRAKLAGAAHPVLCANMRDRDGRLVLPESIVLEASGLRVGVFGVMVAMVMRGMRTQAASAYIWDPPIPAALRVARELRGSVDLLIALTHIGVRQDQELATQCPEIDLILGGHSHTLLEHPVKVGRTFICQGGSHGRYAGLYEVERGRLTGSLASLTMERG